MAVDLALADDTLIDTAPDVVFHLAGVNRPKNEEEFFAGPQGDVCEQWRFRQDAGVIGEVGARWRAAAAGVDELMVVAW